MIKALVVDDMPMARKVVGYHLASHFHVLEASNGLMAMEIIKHENPGIIISDINMPEMDGVTLLKKLNADGLLYAANFYFSTTETLDDDILEGYKKIGLKGYIKKPFGEKELLKVLKKGEGNV